MRDWSHGDRRIERTVQGGGRSEPDGREDPFRTSLPLCIDGLAKLRGNNKGTRNKTTVRDV